MDLPNYSPVTDLLSLAASNPDRVVIRDHSTKIELTSAQLLDSVVAVRNSLRRLLPVTALRKLQKGNEDVFVLLLASSGFEFVVTTLAVITLGAAIIPISTHVGAKLMIDTSHADAILYLSAAEIEAGDVLAYLNSCGGAKGLCPIRIEVPICASPARAEDYIVERESKIQAERAAIVFFTSGSTGNPKGVIHTYRSWTARLQLARPPFVHSDFGTMLHRSPVHWQSTMRNVHILLCAGSCIEFCLTVWSEQWFWERILQGDVRVLSLWPRQYSALVKYFSTNLAHLPEADEYLSALKGIKLTFAGGVPFPETLQQEWKQLRGGKGFLKDYGSTETGLMIWKSCAIESNDNLASMGSLAEGFEAKFAENGELLIKSPWMFSRYIAEDPNATDNAFTADGYYKTGDVVEKHGEEYVYRGRLSTDVFTYFGIKIYTPDVEHALLSLPYVASATVLATPDDFCNQRATAIIATRNYTPHTDLKSSSASMLTPPSTPPSTPASGELYTLDQLRSDLAEHTKLDSLYFPSKIYWLAEGEEVPLTGTGKVAKKEAAKRFFGSEKGRGRMEVLGREEEEGIARRIDGKK